jgi:hypothetical protein
LLLKKLINSGQGVQVGATDRGAETPITYEWKFRTDGSFELPVGLKFKYVGMGWGGLTCNDQAVSILAQGTGDYADNTLGGITVGGSSGAGVVNIEANNHSADPALYASWTFQPEGRISFPYRTGNARTGAGENLQFIKSNDQKIISTAPGNIDFPTVERLVIAGGDSYYDGAVYPSGEAGDIYLWAGRGYNGGDIKVDAGNSLSGQEGGTVKIRGGNSDSGTGGFVEISAGYGGGTPGQIRLINAGQQWTFNGSGQIVFPDGSIQTTAWAKRIVSVPTTSLGQAGDKQGDIAFNGSYMYYCTADYTPASYEATLQTGYSGGNQPTLIKGSYPQPQIGWSFVWNTVTYTLVSYNATDPNPGEWFVFLDQNIDTTPGGSITLNTNVAPANIWKRVAWSNDTW